MKYTDIFTFIKGEEANYNKPIEVIQGWYWSMKEHIRRGFLYFNSQFANNNDKRDTTPFKNIIRIILNAQFRTEGFNVQDINFYINELKKYYKSYLLRKYHERWARNNQIDTFIDEVIESAVIYGGALIKNVKGAKPEMVDLTTLAFCDQRDLLSRPFGIKHYMSVEELIDMESFGWGDGSKGATISIDRFIELTREQQKVNDGNIEIYEIHGILPEKWLGGDNSESKKYVRQEYICAYYKNQNNDEIGVILFRTKAPKQLFKLLKRDNINGRALGFGGVEELFDSQVWTNYAMIREKDFLDSASKTILKTTDSGVVNRHPSGLKDLDNLEVVELAEGKELNQIDIFPRNFQIFNNTVDEWMIHAQKLGSANPPLLGEEAPSGTPFRAQERQVIEGKGIHEYRKEKFTRFIEEVYRDWIIPQLSKEIANGVKFIAELDLEILQKIAENMSIIESNKVIVEKILNGELINEQEIELLKQTVKTQFLKGGKKRFLEILKDEMRDAPMEVEVDIAGKNKDLGAFSDKLSKIIIQIIANPDGFARMMQIPSAAKAFNQMMEASGLSPIEFDEFSQLVPQIQQLQQMQLNKSAQPILAT